MNKKMTPIEVSLFNARFTSTMVTLRILKVNPLYVPPAVRRLSQKSGKKGVHHAYVALDGIPSMTNSPLRSVTAK